MKNLVNQLRAETTELKRKFIEATKHYATTEFKRLSELKHLDEYTLGNQEFGFELEDYVDKRCFGDSKPRKRFAPIKSFKWDSEARKYVDCFLSFYRHKDSLKLDKLISLISSTMRMGLDKYVAKQVELAAAHYENSIIKLAQRVMRKNLDLNNIEMQTSVMDVNIETIISDGNKSVRAWTIIASGAIQKPHYRYLVK
jgi:hypothetical protein